MPKYLITLAVLTICIYSCNNNTAIKKGSNAKKKKEMNKLSVADSIKMIRFKDNISFYADSILKDGDAIMQHYISRYQPDSCGPIIYKDSILKADWSATNIVKGIKSHKKADTVFVIPPLNYCDEGASYCFYDKNLPRLYTDSYCCQAANLFVISDIDEDGINEIGIYYSSCASRYKSLKLYSLKNSKWHEIGNSIFDVLTQDPGKVKLENLVKKISKGKFSICNFTDGKTKWETTSM